MLFGSIWGDQMDISEIKVCVLRIEGTNNEGIVLCFQKIGCISRTSSFEKAQGYL